MFVYSLAMAFSCCISAALRLGQINDLIRETEVLAFEHDFNRVGDGRDVLGMMHH